MSSTVVSERAEAAISLLNQTLGFHKLRTVAAPALQVSRLGTTGPDISQVQRQSTLVRLISVTEAFCVDRLLELAELHMDPGSNAIRELVWSKTSTNAVSTWNVLQETYKNWFAVKGIWAEIDRLLEARNAIAHGLGTLTRMQQSKGAAVRTKISAAGIEIIGAQLQLEETNLEDARDTCRDLIESVDKGVSDHPLSATIGP